MTRWLRRILIVVALVAGVGFVLYTRMFRPMQVIGLELVRADLVVETMGTGTIEARTSAIVSATIHGRLVELAVDQGDHVEAGLVIARLDDSDLAQQVEIAQANVEAAAAGVDRLRADQARAQAVLRRAEREDDRIRRAFEAGAATETEIDKSAEQRAIAQADIARAAAAIAEGQKLFIAARKTHAYQQARLDDTVIRAPFDGLIVRRDRDPGDIVVPGASIYRLIAVDEIWVSAWVDETAIESLASGQPTRIVLRSEPDRPYPGHVVRLGLETDRETREFVVDVAIGQLPQQWAIGQRAEVYIETDRVEQVIVVPFAFVSVVDGERGVFVDRGGHAAWVRCEFGARGRTMIELQTGVELGDVVVRLADATVRKQLTDGRRVVVQ